MPSSNSSAFLAPSVVHSSTSASFVRASTVATSSSFSTAPQPLTIKACIQQPSKNEVEGVSRRDILQSASVISISAILANLTQSALVQDENANVALAAAPPATASWIGLDLGTENTIYDIAFVDDKHGWMVGSRGTVYETLDGGYNWKPRSFSNLSPEDEINYRFEKITFKGDEGWVIGKPALMLHTKDAGNSWERIQLSPKLPGEPVSITALGVDKAEMTTTAGAVYTTTNGARNWKAEVKETIDATLNRTISSGVSGASYFTGSIIDVVRDSSGAYLAISSRGNFFLTWKPGQDFWIPHGRDTSRRIQAMGFIKDNIDNGLWESTRGGGLGFSSPKLDLDSVEAIIFDKRDLKTGGYGILDVSFRPGTDDVYAALGGGSIYVSKDGGKTWKKDSKLDKVGSNIYKIKFIDRDNAYALGGQGVVLKFKPDN